MKFLLYEGRHGEKILVHHDQNSFDYLRKQQDQDNNCTLEDCGEMGLDYGGSFEDGHFWIDDGGNIETIELTNLYNTDYA